MERLLADATAISGIEFNIDSYADVVDAIHIIQTEMGITGTTANEASSTISGSLSSMKAAWQNLIAGLGNEDVDLSGLIEKFTNSALTVADNVVPRIGVILGGITDALAQMMPLIAEKLPELLNTLLPPLIEAAVELVKGLVVALPTILQILIEQMPFIITEISAALIEVFPILLNTVKDLFTQIWDYISLELLNTGVSFEDACSNVTKIFSDLWAFCQEIWDMVGQPIWDMISFAIDGLVELFNENMPAIQEFFSGAIDGIKDSWENHLKPALDAIGTFLDTVLKPAFEKAFEAILPFVEDAFETIGSYWTDVLKPLFDGICDFITNVFSGNWEEAWEGITSTFETVFGNLVNIAKKPINGVIGLVNSMIDAINTVSFTIPNWVPKLGGETFGFDLDHIPLLEQGGVLERGQVGLLEGNGAEAVVPLDQNEKWINRVAQDMGAATGNDALLQKILDVLTEIRDSVPEEFADIIASMKFAIGEREFARLVKAVN